MTWLCQSAETSEEDCRYLLKDICTGCLHRASQISEVNLIRKRKQGNFPFNHFSNGHGANRASWFSIRLVQIEKFYFDKAVFPRFSVPTRHPVLCERLTVLQYSRHYAVPYPSSRWVSFICLKVEISLKMSVCHVLAKSEENSKI